MEDLIDKRNRKQKIAQSVVKRWNVHYMTEEEVRAQQAQMQSQFQEQVEPQVEEMPASEILERPHGVHLLYR